MKGAVFLRPFYFLCDKTCLYLELIACSLCTACVGRWPERNHQVIFKQANIDKEIKPYAYILMPAELLQKNLRGGRREPCFFACFFFSSGRFYCLHFPLNPATEKGNVIGNDCINKVNLRQ